MSSVVSVSVFSERPLPDGNVRRRFSVVLEDNNSVQVPYIIGPFTVSAGVSLSVVGARHLQSVVNDDIAGIQISGDPLNYALNPRWATSKEIAKHAIRWMFRERDPYIVIQLEPLLTYIQSNYNANQAATFLDITTGQVLALNRRINAILSDTGNVKALLSAYDAEQGDIE